MREFEGSETGNHGTKRGKDSAVTRREFLEMGVAATLAVGAEKLTWAADTKGNVPLRTLGRTGEKISMVGLGGYHIGSQKDEQESIRIIRTALDNGINFLDNCWDYNGGNSEVRVGKALRDGYRQRAFVMTKIDGRTKKAAAQQLEESLRRLQTDRIDLLQFHEIIRMEDPDRVFAAGGGMEAVVEAQKAGKVRYIGFTGHKSPDIHLKMLDTADARRDYRLRFRDPGGAGGGGGANLPADERNASCGAAGEDKGSGAKWRVRRLQDDHEFRRHRAQSAVAGVRQRSEVRSQK